MNKILIPILIISLAVTSFFLYRNLNKETQTTGSIPNINLDFTEDAPEAGIKERHPLNISYMREQEYPGSDLVIEQTLPNGSNYKRYIVSYKSDGLKIYALLTVPTAEVPEGGWPVIVFNHGYIPPDQYRTTEKYIAYTDVFSRNGYILIRPDYRGHGNSEGKPEGAYYSPSYTIDVLNAVASIKKYENVNPEKIGMWGHSMGGSITLRSMVTTNDVKVGVIWAGVVASYEDMANNWKRSIPWQPSPRERNTRRPSRQELVDKYGDFEQNPEFWKEISPIYHVENISGPLQIHHGTNDGEVPALFSEKLDEAMKSANKTTELYIYSGDDHNLSKNLSIALARSVDFFDQYLK
jgi:uncharacterized protein